MLKKISLCYAIFLKTCYPALISYQNKSNKNNRYQKIDLSSSRSSFNYAAKITLLVLILQHFLRKNKKIQSPRPKPSPPPLPRCNDSTVGGRREWRPRPHEESWGHLNATAPPLSFPSFCSHKHTRIEAVAFLLHYAVWRG